MKEKFLKKEDFLNFETKFLEALTIVSSIACGLSVISNIFLGLPISMIFLPALLGLAFVGFYYWAKSTRKALLLKICYTSLTLFLLNMIWVYNNGSHGPSPYLFIVFFGVLVFIWSGIQLWIVTFVFFINILTIFYIDYTHPYLIPNYKTDLDRIFDVYTGDIVFGIVIFALMNKAKNDLMSQYLKAKRADMLKSAFLANMSHEIRTPMNAIYGFSQILKDVDFSDAEKKQYLDLICNQSNYLLSIVNELIDISKIESGSLVIYNDLADLNEIISEALNGLNHLKRKDVEIKLVTGDNLIDQKIVVDSVRLQQVITNLMSNAIKYTDKGYVELGYQMLDDGFIQIYVKDTGIGIPQQEIGKIFDRFYQVESKNKNVMNEGTGLGLAIASAIIRQMGGDIWVESIENEGSIFFFTIPYKPVNISKTQRRIRESAKVADLRGRTVMIVDDQKSNYLFLKDALSTINCKLIWRENGKDAVKFIKNKNKVDLVLMDSDMPEMDGYTATRMIKQLRPSLPVIIQSLFTSEDKLDKIKEAGCDDYITKPIRLIQFKDLLRKYLPE